MSKLPLSLAAAALVAALAWWWDAMPGPDGAASPPQAHRAPAVSEPSTAADLPLQRSALPAQSRDLFATPPKPRAQTPVSTVVEAPKALPLPFKYDGSGELQGKSFVFLARDGRSFMVSAGDTIDG